MSGQYRPVISSKLGGLLGIAVHGHWGPPVLAFPSEYGNEWEYEHQGVVEALKPLIQPGRLKLYTVFGKHQLCLHSPNVPASERISQQRQFAECILEDVFKAIRNDCAGVEMPITTIGVGAGAYHAVNTILRHPQIVRQCCACSGVYDIAPLMDGFDSGDVYFNNPMAYLPNLEDPELTALRRCAIQLVTGDGAGEDKRDADRLGQLLERKGLKWPVDDLGQHYRRDWASWKFALVRYFLEFWRAEP